MLLAADAFADSLDELRVVFESNLGIGIELINPKLHLMECFVFILGGVLALPLIFIIDIAIGFNQLDIVEAKLASGIVYLVFSKQTLYLGYIDSIVLVWLIYEVIFI